MNTEKRGFEQQSNLCFSVFIRVPKVVVNLVAYHTLRLSPGPASAS
jgi:hypothetical protein